MRAEYVLGGGAVIAIEVLRELMALIHPAAEHTHGQGVLGNAKPQQDMRFDVPAIGEKTIESSCSRDSLHRNRSKPYTAPSTAAND